MMDNNDIREGFKIEDDSAAEWALGRIKEAQTDTQRMADHYKKQMDAITARNQGTIDYMRNLLLVYFETVPRRTTKGGTQKYVLPSGELIKKPESVDYQRDNDALLAWCQANKPEFIKTEESPKWADVKSYIKATGEIPPGVTPIEKASTFDVKIEGVS